MADVIVLVICPDNMGDHIEHTRLESTLAKIEAEGKRPLMLSDNTHRRVLEKALIRSRACLNAVVFTNEHSPELEELVSLARQYHLYPQKKKSPLTR